MKYGFVYKRSCALGAMCAEVLACGSGRGKQAGLAGAIQ